MLKSITRYILKCHDAFLLKKGKSFVFCTACGRLNKILVLSDNLREDGLCIKCRSNSRKRHLASLFLKSLRKRKKALRFSSLRKIPSNISLKLYNVESNGALHENLKHIDNYVSSEYFGPYEIFGAAQNGVLNVDLQNIPFEDESVDYIISTEVFEHVPDPYKAFKEVYRILRTGGAHIFTVPFIGGVKDEVRSILNDNNEIVYLMSPQYHGDPIGDEKGILVYTLFSEEMFSKLEAIGFNMRVDRSRNPFLGILGAENIVFSATKM